MSRLFLILKLPFVYISGTFRSGKTHLCKSAEKLLGETWSIRHRKYKGLDFLSLVRTRTVLISNVSREALLYNATEIADGTCLVLSDSSISETFGNYIRQVWDKRDGESIEKYSVSDWRTAQHIESPVNLGIIAVFYTIPQLLYANDIQSRGIQIAIPPICNELSQKIGDLQETVLKGVLGEEEEIREKYTTVWDSTFYQDERRVYFDLGTSGYTISNIKNDPRGRLHLMTSVATFVFMREYKGSWDTAQMRKNWDGDYYHIAISVAKEDLEKAIEVFYAGQPLADPQLLNDYTRSSEMCAVALCMLDTLKLGQCGFKLGQFVEDAFAMIVKENPKKRKDHVRVMVLDIINREPIFSLPTDSTGRKEYVTYIRGRACGAEHERFNVIPLDKPPYERKPLPEISDEKNLASSWHHICDVIDPQVPKSTRIQLWLCFYENNLPEPNFKLFLRYFR